MTSLALVEAPSPTETVLVQLEDLRAALAAPDVGLDDALSVRSKAELLRSYARNARLSIEVVNQAVELRLRAERRCGALLREMLEQGGPIKRHDGQVRDRRALPNGALQRLGISSTESSAWMAVALIPAAEFEQRIAAASTHKRALTVAAFVRAARQFLRQPGRGGNGPSSPTLNALRKVLALMREIKTLSTPAEVDLARAVVAIGEAWSVELESCAPTTTRTDVTAREVTCLLCGRTRPPSKPPRCEACGGVWLTA